MLTGDEVRFDGWTLRRKAGELAKDGRRIRLQSQPLMILEQLLAQPGELVAREELIARLWPQGVVDFDTALNSAVRRLRTALDDQAERPRYIETIPRRGYRFIGRLETPQAAVAPALAMAPVRSGRGRSWLVATVALVVVMAAASYVVADLRGPAFLPGSANPQAQELYLRAEHFYQRRGEGDLALARRYFEETLAIDPEFAEAWSGLSSALWISIAEGQLPPEPALARVRETAERALELDPALAEPHVRLANYWRFTGDARKADEQLRSALELHPGDPLVLTTYASQLASEGRYPEAAALQQRALDAQPLSHAFRYNLGVYLYFSGRPAEAEQEMIKLRELNPKPLNAPELHGILLLTTGRHGEALALAQAWPEEADRLYIAAMALDRLGRRAESDEALRKLVESEGAREGFRIAEVYAQRGDADRAFEWLHAGEAHQRANARSFGRRPLWLLEHSPFLQALRQDPRWARWYAAARQPWRQAAAGQH